MSTWSPPRSPLASDGPQPADTPEATASLSGLGGALDESGDDTEGLLDWLDELRRERDEIRPT